MRPICIGILLMLVACQDVKYPQAPENLIPEEQMMDIMADAYSGHAARSVNNRVLRSNQIQLDSSLYNKYGIDSLQFARSNAYYTVDLNRYEKLLKGVEERLMARKAEADSAMNRERKRLQNRKDSVQAKSPVGIGQGTKMSK